MSDELEIEQGERYTLSIFRGETFRRTFRYVDSDENPIDISNYTARMQIRATDDSDAVLHESTTENGDITISGPAGEVALKIQATDTADWTWVTGVYDLEIVSPSPDFDVEKLIPESRVRVKPEVTR